MEFRPKKSFGQNFLQNAHVLQKIIDSAGLTGNEVVIEVGPGFGALTQALCTHARKVIAIEKDVHLYEFLKEQFSDALAAKKLELILGDALKVAPPHEPYFLIANIPYSITSPLLDHFIRDNCAHLPARAVVLVQKEVAEKICARPPHMNVLALHVQTFGVPKMVAQVSKHNFKPVPKVDSSIVKIEFEAHKETPRRPHEDYEKYFELIHRGFSHKRKMLRAVFPQALLIKAGIEPTRRAETLSIEEWQKLAATSV